MEQEKPKILKIMPFRGLNEELLEGSKTKLTLHENFMEYKTKGTQLVVISLTKDSVELEDKPAKHYSDEEGILEKTSINSITQYIETNYDLNGDHYIINYIDITYSGTNLTFSCETKEERINTYKELIKWKFNKE